MACCGDMMSLSLRDGGLVLARRCSGFKLMLPKRGFKLYGGKDQTRLANTLKFNQRDGEKEG
jgi:hypothetical protein